MADGEVRAGERLPPARDLAAVLGVNVNTVFRGLRTLRDEGLVEFRRGRGVTVSGIGPERSAVVAKARELVEVARRCGYRPEELADRQPWRRQAPGHLPGRRRCGFNHDLPPSVA